MFFKKRWLGLRDALTVIYSKLGRLCSSKLHNDSRMKRLQRQAGLRQQQKVTKDFNRQLYHTRCVCSKLDYRLAWKTRTCFTMEITYRVKHNGCGRLYLSRRKEKKKIKKEKRSGKFPTSIQWSFRWNCSIIKMWTLDGTIFRGLISGKKNNSIISLLHPVRRLFNQRDLYRPS